MPDSVGCVLITFNRLEFLKEIVQALKNQTKQIDEIFVINNSSTDGTAEWLAGQEGLTVINQDNVGSSGGQYTGIQAAYQAGYDWVWTMDDDVVPRPDCLETLLSIKDHDLTVRTPLRYTPSGLPFHNDAIDYNLSNPFSSIWNEILNDSHLDHPVIPAIGITFEGPLMHRSVIQKIGLPQKNFFIYGDDTEYFIRAWKAGAKIAVIRDARFDRKLEFANPNQAFSWKHYYVIRNIIAIDILHASLPVRLIRPFGYLLTWLKRADKWQDYKTVFKAFWDGYFYKSEN